MDVIRDLLSFVFPGVAITVWMFEKADQSGMLRGTKTGEVVDGTKAVLRKYVERKKKNEYEIKV